MTNPKPNFKFKFKPAPMTIAIRSIKCLEETDEVGPDEPYVLVVGVDLKKAVPHVEVTRYGPWSDVDQGETKSTMMIPNGASAGLPVLMTILVQRSFNSRGRTYFFLLNHIIKRSSSTAMEVTTRLPSNSSRDDVPESMCSRWTTSLSSYMNP